MDQKTFDAFDTTTRTARCSNTMQHAHVGTYRQGPWKPDYTYASLPLSTPRANLLYTTLQAQLGAESASWAVLRAIKWCIAPNDDVDQLEPLGRSNCA